jgi:hypothetical protein
MARQVKDSPKDRRAAAIRDAAREIVRREGVWREVGIPGGEMIRVRSADFENISILYTTPFQPLPQPSNSMKYQAALLGSDAGRGAYLIDVWVAGKKAFFCAMGRR